MLPFYLIKKIPALDSKIYNLYLDRAAQIAPRIIPFIAKTDKVLDLGAGTGTIAKVIRQNCDCQMTLVDIQHNPMCQALPVVIYDGVRLPYEDNQFSVSLLTAVLHHTKNPMKVLDEAKRVTSDKLIVMEDVFTDFLGRVITFVGDCLINWEIHSPSKNFTTEQWKKIFEKRKLKIAHLEEFKLICVGFPFKLALFVLKKK